MNKLLVLVLVLLSLVACSDDEISLPDAVPSYWNETAVRKVLHTFAYGGHTSDQQIAVWAAMQPEDAIDEILTLDAINEKLSPIEDTTPFHGDSLEALQTFWSSDAADNPMRHDRRQLFSVLTTSTDGSTTTVSHHNVRNTWITAMQVRGLNPFRQKMGFFLTNYHMAVSPNNVRPHLMRKLYDSSIDKLNERAGYHAVLALGATSAAVAHQYGHNFNIYNNQFTFFRGNDDFAREYHQLFFRILGEDNPDYHENVTIENTAKALTGMSLDRLPNALESSKESDWWRDTIDFTDHIDLSGKAVNNMSNHHAAELEILHHTIHGTTAEEKLVALSEIAINHPESLDALPVYIIEYFADDNLTPEKIQAIRELWRKTPDKDLLRFLRDYAISDVFHREDTFKYRTSFNRHLTIFTQNTVDNEEAYNNPSLPIVAMRSEGVEVFKPSHVVFGSQTGKQAANNPNIFREAYNLAVGNPWHFMKTSDTFTDASGNEQVWEKDWARVVPGGQAVRAGKLGEWLWTRFTGDSGKNYGPLERAHVTSLLATGMDLGHNADPLNADRLITVKDLEAEPLTTLVAENVQQIVVLDDSDPAVRREANRRVGMAISFITVTPFMFALEAR